jgi:hypothetical protein
MINSCISVHLDLAAFVFKYFAYRLYYVIKVLTIQQTRQAQLKYINFAVVRCVIPYNLVDLFHHDVVSVQDHNLLCSLTCMFEVPFVSDLVMRLMFCLFIYSCNPFVFRTNIPKEIMPFPDFPFHETETSFVHHSDVLIYLKQYAQYYDLNKHIRVSLSLFKLPSF